MVINKKDIFNIHTLNIFTDASIKKISNETIGCPGAIAIATADNGQEYMIDKLLRIERNATNNSSEIRAVALGVYLASKYNNRYKTINLFSDSKICIYGLREWIFNWVNCINQEKMYNSSGNLVANQEIFVSIIQTIINDNIVINLYHQKGHVSNTQVSISNAVRVFKESNKIEVSMELMKILSEFNNYIDIETGEYIEYYLKEYNQYPNCVKNIYNINPENLQTSVYKELINFGKQNKKISNNFFDRR